MSVILGVIIAAFLSMNPLGPVVITILALWSLPIFVWRRYGRRPASICILAAFVCTGMLAIGPTP